MSTRIAPRASAALAVVSALALAGLIAASSADAATIYACVKKSNGNARIVSKKAKCKKGETKISWNNVGPAGKNGSPGTNGAPGTNGSTGPQGPSNGYQAFKDEVGFIETESTIGTLAVPAGSYLVSAKLWVENTEAERVHVSCTLTNDKNSDKDETIVTDEPYNGVWFGRTDIVLEAASTLSSAGHWSVKCASSFLGVFGWNLKIHAIQVGSLSNTPA